MSALGNLVVALSLEYATYTKGLNKSDQDTLRFAKNTQDAMDKMERSVNSYIGKVAGIGAAYLSVTNIFSSFNKQVDALAQLDDAAQKTGAAVEVLSKLQKTAVAFGEDFGGKIEPAITKLARGIAGLDDPSNKANAALKALGISARDSNGQLRDSAQITIDVAKALQNYRDDASKAALVTDLFGKSGAELLPFLNDAAENVDKFSSVSAQAAANGASLQDSINAQKQRFDEFQQQLTIDVLPAITDLAGAFLDVQSNSNKLSNDKSIVNWADNLALTIAPLYDTVVNLKNEIYAIGKSFQVVYADLNVAKAQINTVNPYSYVFGDPNKNLKEAESYKARILGEANAAYADLVNRPRDEYEQALRKRMADRPGNYGSPVPSASNASKQSTGYVSGLDAKNATDSKAAATAADQAKKAYDSLTASIEKQIEVKRAEYSIDGTLSEADKMRIDIDAKRADGQLKLTDGQYKYVNSLLTTWQAEIQNAEVSAIRVKAEQDYLTIVEQTTAARDQIYTDIQDETVALEELARAKVEEIDQLSMTKEQLDALNVARYNEQIGVLETQKAYLQSQPDRENEIELIQRQIDALETLRGTVGKAEAVNKSKQELADMFGSMEQASHVVWTVFANGGENAAQAVGKAIKASILDLLYQITIKKFFVNVVASTSVGSSVTGALVDPSMQGSGSIIDRIADGFKSLNTNFTGSIEKLGAYLAESNVGMVKDIGGFLGQYSNQIANGIGYLGAAYMLSQGNVAGAALTAAGTYFGGPIGGAIGSAIGSFFGGSKSYDRYGTNVFGSYSDGDYKNTKTGIIYDKPLDGTKSALTSLNESFTKKLGSLLESFDIDSDLNVNSALYQRRTKAGGFLAVSGMGGRIANVMQEGSIKEIYQALVDQAFGPGMVKAINASSLPDSIKDLFDGLSDKTQVQNMIAAAISLNTAQDSLIETYNLTAEGAAAVANASGLAGDSLAAFVGSLVNASLSQQSAAAVLLKERADLTELTGTAPTTLKAFDEWLKSINTTTADGQKKFSDMFAARDRVSSITSAFDAITTARDNSIFGLLSQSEQMAISQKKLADAFADVNAEVPGSRDELVKWVNGLDLTTEAGLKAAMAVPALVDAFQSIEDAANSTTNALREMSGFTSLADYRFYKGVANNYGNAYANSYAGVSNLLGSNAQGQTTLNGESIADLKQLLAELRDTSKQALLTQRATQAALEYIQARGLKTT